MRSPGLIQRARKRVASLLKLKGEAGEASQHCAVELALVGLGGGLVERCRVAIAEAGEDVGGRGNEVAVIAIALLGLVALRLLVGVLGGLALGDERGVLAFEEIELPSNNVPERTAPEDQLPVSSRYSSR